jgi:hypothetical protein
MPTAASRARASPERHRRPRNGRETIDILGLAPLEFLGLDDGIQVRAKRPYDVGGADAVHRRAQRGLIDPVLRCPVDPDALRGLTRLDEHPVQVEQDRGDFAH